MIRSIDLRGGGDLRSDLRAELPRADLDVDAALHAVRPICADVHERGETAILEYSERFDGVRPPSLRVPAEQLSAALDAMAPTVRAALEQSIRRARIVHEAQRRTDTATEVVPGGRVEERWVPVERVGLYVPGGKAVYPSSVVMNVVPAQVAGVRALAVASPPQRDSGGWPHPAILGACALLGVTEVYAAGGAQAIAMFAYGAGECAPVDLVTGPGNVYVAAAKRLLRGRVGIDAEAGPTEIAILADDTADPRFVAADLISQAEHDTVAAAVLVTPSERLAEDVRGVLPELVYATKHSERITEALNGRQSAVIVVDDLEAGIRVINSYAAEHVEVQTVDAARIARRVINAGAVFVGPWSPVSLGDYVAGSNHVLPTGGCACHTGGLSVQTFLRGIHVVEYSRDALADAFPFVDTLSATEDLPAHGAAVQARFPDPTATDPR